MRTKFWLEEVGAELIENVSSMPEQVKAARSRKDAFVGTFSFNFEVSTGEIKSFLDGLPDGWTASGNITGVKHKNVHIDISGMSGEEILGTLSTIAGRFGDKMEALVLPEKYMSAWKKLCYAIDDGEAGEYMFGFEM